MDAVTLVAAAVSIACDQSRNAALEDVLRDRELQAMRAADLESFIAQRLYVCSQQLPTSGPQTWQASRNDLAEDYEQLLDALQQVRIANREGDSERIEELIGRELGHSSSDEMASSQSDGSEPESSDQEPPPAPSHRCARCGDTRNLELMLPTGPFAEAPMEARLFCQECLHGS